MKKQQRTEEQENEYRQNFSIAREYLRELELSQPAMFERGSLTDGDQFAKSKKRVTLADAIKTQKQKPAWATEAIACAAVVDEYYNNFTQWE